MSLCESCVYECPNIPPTNDCIDYKDHECNYPDGPCFPCEYMEEVGG